MLMGGGVQYDIRFFNDNATFTHCYSHLIPLMGHPVRKDPIS